jgi:hypothetical protein
MKFWLIVLALSAIPFIYYRYGAYIKAPPLKTFRKEYIDGVGERLIKSFGADHASFDIAWVQVFDHKTVSGVQLIADRVKAHYGLMCNIRVHESAETMSVDGGRNTAAAWIDAREIAPDPKSEEFRNFTYNVTVTNDTLRNSSLVVMIMYIAHELAHAMLHSHNHPDKESEIATDMLAILFGFDNEYFEIFKFNVKTIDDVKVRVREMAEDEYKAQIDSASEYASRWEKLYAYFTLKPDNAGKFIVAQVTDYVFDKGVAKILAMSAGK